nr:NADH dehydrogenase subunit 5 [Parakontikia ventrolineata]
MIYISFLGAFYFLFSLFLLFCLSLLDLPLVFILDLGTLFRFEYFHFWFFFDYYSLVYLFVLSCIVGSVHFFSLSYMESELNLIRFILILNLFVFFMVILVISPNFLSFLLGWDGLGFSSFVLVSWYGCSVSRSSSIKTFLTNRLGDSLLLVTLCFFLGQGHFGFLYYDKFYYFVIFVLLLVSFTKSAHFPFSSWLPDAMAAPTPVSALVHSSTLVTAGLYFMFRFSYVYTPDFLCFIHNFGLWTLFIGSLGACIDYNSKKVVAYSTISQLGFISFILSYGFYDFSFYYIMVHAIFKALLFIAVGDLIGSLNHFQDVRQLSGVGNLRPFSSFNLFFSIFSLCGFPFLSGFFIKELIVNVVSFFYMNYFSCICFILSLICTAFYSFRLLYILCFSNTVSLKLSTTYSSSIYSSLILYYCILFLGYYFSFYNYIWLNLGSSLFIIFFITLSGIISIVFYCNFVYYLNFLDFFNYISTMFYLNCFTFSFSVIYSIGGFFYTLLDKGFLVFTFINHLDYLFSLSWNNIINNFFFSNWIYLLGLSLLFFLSMIILF